MRQLFAKKVDILDFVWPYSSVGILHETLNNIRGATSTGVYPTIGILGMSLGCLAADGSYPIVNKARCQCNLNISGSYDAPQTPEGSWALGNKQADHVRRSPNRNVVSKYVKLLGTLLKENGDSHPLKRRVHPYNTHSDTQRHNTHTPIHPYTLIPNTNTPSTITPKTYTPQTYTPRANYMC